MHGNRRNKIIKKAHLFLTNGETLEVIVNMVINETLKVMKKNGK